MTEPCDEAVGGASASDLAEAVDTHREAVLAGYAAALEASGNPVAQSESALRQAVANSNQILDDVVNSLRAGTVVVDEGYKAIAWDIGASRAAAGMHPRHSLLAASLFFDTALSGVSRLIPLGPQSLELFTLVALSLERSIGLRIHESSSSYTGFLLNKVQEAQVDERRRIARELHDRIGHGMSVTHQQLELYDLYRTSDPAKADAKVENAQQAVRESMANLRAVTSDLHSREPLKNLEKALVAYLQSVETDGVAVRLQVNGDETWAPPRVLDEAFLCIREAVRNALRHSGSTMVFIRVDITPHDLNASVEDNGCGFDPQALSSDGVGLYSMRERAELLRGSAVISSRLGYGTQVDFSIPLGGPAAGTAATAVEAAVAEAAGAAPAGAAAGAPAAEGRAAEGTEQ